MESLDLRKAPPRKPRAEAGGILFLPRTIDKARATLPGGDLGVYKIEGFTASMLEMFDIPLSEFCAVVAKATSDEDVATFVRGRVDDATIAKWDDFARNRLPRNGDRAAAIEHYPWLALRPDLILTLDVLEEDDRQMFLPAS